MQPTPNLFARFASAIAALNIEELRDPRSARPLLLDRIASSNRSVEMIYAPFDHVNTSARLVIVGMTPGKQQATNALRAAHEALRSGATYAEAAQRAKTFASFSGEPMRSNLIKMLDCIGVAKALGVTSTCTLWEEDSDLVHFTSALRYPVFADGQNWSGTPDMVRVPGMRKWLEDYTGTELASLRNAILVPLGPKVSAALQHLASKGFIAANRILSGLPHPSGANSERIAYFLGQKPGHLLSVKTNAGAIDAAREALSARVTRL